MSQQYKVKFVDYPQEFKKMESEVMSTIHEVLSKGDLMMRQQLVQFEEELAEFVGTKAAVGVNSCTDGLFLTLKALDIGPGDEVITVSHTFVATASAIHHSGAAPILVDVMPDHAMDPAKVEEAITARTKAIIPVHVNGYLCAMDEICAIAKRHNLLILEDSAQALGAHYQGKKGGAWGIAGTFSFYPAKQLGAYGDGGAITTDDLQLADKLKLLRNHGRKPDGDLIGFAFNSRLDNLHAAILSLKLKKIPQWVQERRAIAQKYCDALSGISELKLPQSPSTEDSRYSSFQNFEFEAQDRDNLLQHLRTNGIEIITPWGGHAIHQFQALELGHFRDKLPLTEMLFEHIMTLPMRNGLTEAETDYVIETVQKFYS